MTTGITDRTLDQQRVIHLDTVALVNVHGAAGVTPDLLRDSLRRHIPDPVTDPASEQGADSGAGISSVDEVYSSLIADVSRAHFDRVAATVNRRRSLTDSLQHALAAYWEAVVDHREEHLALRSIQARRIETLALRPDPHSAWPSVTSGVSTWLDLVATAHRIRWELPAEQLTLLLTATLEGLTLDYLVTGDPGPAREVLRVVAYQVAQYGRRPAKNQQH